MFITEHHILTSDQQSNPEDDGTSPSANLDWVGNEDDEEEDLPDIVSGSPEDAEY